MRIILLLLLLVATQALAQPPAVEGVIVPLFDVNDVHYGDTIDIQAAWTGRLKPNQRLHVVVSLTREIPGRTDGFKESVYINYGLLAIGRREFTADGIVTAVLEPYGVWRPDPSWLPSDTVCGTALLQLYTDCRRCEATIEYLDRFDFIVLPQR